MDSIQSSGGKLTNWAGNLVYKSDNVFHPKTVDEVSDVVRKFPKLKVLGSRHCFSDIADSTGAFISLDKLQNVLNLDADAMTVTVEGGINYGQLSGYLHEKGYALHNLASLPHISVVGACATATHGSGVKHGNLATSVQALEVITHDGSLVKLSQGDTHFDGAVVNLGAIGVITKMTISIVPSFEMCQHVFHDLSFHDLIKNFNEIMSAGYSVSLFTDWSKNVVNEVWIKSVCNGPPVTFNEHFFGATAAVADVHPIRGMSPENCTTQMGKIGPWFERLPHFKMGFTPSSGVELQSEYFIPVEKAADAILALNTIGHLIKPQLLISEIRSIAGDELWMSPCYHQDSVAFHFTWKQDWHAVRIILPEIEKLLGAFHAKPHWGKLFTYDRNVIESRFTRIGDFKKLVDHFDPEHKFRNDFLSRLVLA